MSTFVLSTVVKDVGVDLDTQLPIIHNSSQDFTNAFTDDTGETIKVRKPDFRSGLTSGLDVTSADKGIVQASVDLTLSPFSEPIEVTLVEQAFKAGNMQDMVVNPVISRIGSDVQTNHLTQMFLKFGAAKVVNSGTADYKDVGALGASIDSSRLIGNTCFASSPTVCTQIKQSGLLYVQASSLDKTFATSAIGNIDGIEIIKTADIGTITASARTLGAGTATYVKTKVDTEGATGFIIKVAGGTATLTGGLKKGEFVYVDGYYGVDKYGKATTDLFPFVQQSDVAASGNEIVVTCQPIYFTGPNKNVSVAQSVGIAANAAVTFGLTAEATYRKGIAWKKPAVIFAARPLPKIDGTESMSVTTLKGVPFLASKFGNGLTGTNLIVWRLMFGSAVAYNNGIAAYFVKV